MLTDKTPGTWDALSAYRISEIVEGSTVLADCSGRNDNSQKGQFKRFKRQQAKENKTSDPAVAVAVWLDRQFDAPPNPGPTEAGVG
jgi:hypothetical protein